MGWQHRQPLATDNPWFTVRDGHPAGLALYRRHYSRRVYADGRSPRLFVGPGAKLVLLVPDGRALFVWRKFLSMDEQEGINCAVFRNESPVLSSSLILAAEEFAQQRWPGERMYTYVNPDKVQSPNPGYCFLMAGWRRCGLTKKSGLHIFEKLLE